MTDPRPVEPSSRDSYYAQAASWAVDKEQARLRTTRIAWSIASIAIGVVLLEATALVLLLPLKSVEPYTILVDRNTGQAQLLKGAQQDQVTASEALTQSLLAQYVIAREGFDLTSVKSDFRKVALWSGEPVRSSYLALMQSSNPASPFQRIPRTSVISVRVKSISPIAQETALVRFDATRLDQGQVEGISESFVSVVRYRFSRAPMTLEDRLINPLGFQVIHYRRDQEILFGPTANAVNQMMSPGASSSESSTMVSQ